MRLLGVEIRNFASFKKQFIPLKPGINVLVGKNNSGKTAALAALECLAALPFTDSPKRSGNPDLMKYCHDGSSFELATVFALEREDPPFVRNAPTNEDSSQWVLRLEYRISAGHTPVFQHGVLSTKAGKEFKVLVKADGAEQAIRHLKYDHQSTEQVVNQTVSIARMQKGEVYSADVAYAKALRAWSVRRLLPHRVPISRADLASVDKLGDDAANLATFLHTLHSNDRKRFGRIEAFIVEVFEEFSTLNTKSIEGKTSITLTRRSDEVEVPLTHCGTGVEQILIIAAFFVTTASETVVLIDEPHSFLHPTAERALMRFLREFPDHYIVISTHSAVLINSVSADRITRMGSGSSVEKASDASAAAILHDLGYQNSDLLFFDRLIFVEGPSDADILPELLRKSGQLKEMEIEHCGFPTMEGSGRLEAKKAERSLPNHEKLLFQLGLANQPRVYLFDGDKEEECSVIVERLQRNNPNLAVMFLRKSEIENYLINAEAIAKAMSEEAGLMDIDIDASAVSLQKRIDELLELTNDEELFPCGASGRAPIVAVKGSVVLKRLYEDRDLNYTKNYSGKLIAKRLPQGAEGLSELVESLLPLFGSARPA